MQKLGFIGLGIMGKPMARNLLHAGYPLTAYDIDPKPLDEIVKAGAKRGSSIRDVTENSDVIVTMLPNSPDVQKVALGSDGIIQAARTGQILIDMSSIAPMVTKRIATELGKKGVEILDAPVSGGQEKAQTGKLAIMVGGSESTFNACKHILSILGGTVTYVGEIGAGQTTKLVNQAIVAINIAAVAEGMVLGKRCGVDPERIFNAIRGGLAASQCLEDKAPRMFSGNYTPGFKMKLHVKDLANVLETGHELHNALPLTAQVMEMMQSLLREGYSEVDHGGLSLFYEKLNNLSLKQPQDS